MIDGNDVLIGVSLGEIIRKWPAPTAVFRGQSSTSEASFEYETGPLSDETIEKCKGLAKHGMSVVNAESGWETAKQWESAKWKVSIIERAMKRMELSVASGVEFETKNPNHDPDFADLVLKTIFTNYPNPVTVFWLKYHLEPEPSDMRLLTALRALTIEKLIEGDQKLVRSIQMLQHMADIELTATGVSRCRGEAKSSTQQVTNNVYGQNSRITFGTDNSTNSVMGTGELFGRIKSDLDSALSNDVRKDEVVMALEEVQQATTKETAMARYRNFVSLVADHAKIVSVIAPHFGPLLHWIEKLSR